MNNYIPLFTVKEVAEILHVNRNCVYDLIHNGLLPALKLGSLKVRKDALDQFLERYEGYDLTNMQDIVRLDCVNISSV